MESRFYLKFFTIIFVSFFILFGLTWLVFEKTEREQKRELLKAKLKAESFSQRDWLDERLDVLDLSFDSLLKEIKQQGLISNSPQENTINKISKTHKKNHKVSGAKLDKSNESPSKETKSISVADAIFLKLFVFDKKDLSRPIYTKTTEESEFFQALDLNNKRDFLLQEQAYFEKVKWQGKPYLVLFQLKDSQIFVVFLKKSYFKIDQVKSSLKHPRENKVERESQLNPSKKTQLPKTNLLKTNLSKTNFPKIDLQSQTQSKVLFATFNKNQDRFFYNTHIKDSPKLIEAFFKDSSSKYITRKSKKNQILYYLQEWKGTNLLLITQKEIPFHFLTAFIEKDNSFLVLVALALLFLILLIFILYSKLAVLFQAYSFLKSSVINYSETGHFPEDSSKNSFLSFYRNRQEILNEITKEDSIVQDENLQLQELLEQEIKKIKKKHPHLVLKEDFQIDIKMFGFQNFFRTVLNELLSNAIESMGAMKEQKIDLFLKEENQYLILSVRDYGTGLKDPEKAFQIYYSTKSQLGVGLNLVQSIVTANQGQIELIPQEEGGSLALVRLPLSCFLKK